MFSRSNECFADIAADPARRRAKMAELERYETWVFWGFMLLGLSTIIGNWTGREIGIILVGAFLYVVRRQCVADLRLLKVIEKLEEKYASKCRNSALANIPFSVSPPLPIGARIVIQGLSSTGSIADGSTVWFTNQATGATVGIIATSQDGEIVIDPRPIERILNAGDATTILTVSLTAPAQPY